MAGAVIPKIDLWHAAIEKLDPDLKASLLGVDGDELDLLASVLHEAENKKKLCLQKRLKIRFNGKVIILRDVFDKIIAWVNEFKAIVDVAIQFDPTAASLPWAGIRFLLQVAVSDKQCFESTIHGLEFVSHIIARYAAIEVLYMSHRSIVHEELQSKLTSLYVQILEFLAKSVQYFNQSTATRMLKSIFQHTQDKQLKDIAAIDEEIGKLERISDAEVQQQTRLDVAKIRVIMETLENPLNRLVDASMIYGKTLQEREFYNSLKWLSSVPYSQHHARHSEKRLPGSTKWLLEHPQYISWQVTSYSTIFLLHGIPGCGKTSLVSTIIDTFLDEKSRNSLAIPLAYFYCGDSKFGRDDADPDEIMRSLTRQLAVIDKTKQVLHEQIYIEYERKAAEAKIDGFEVPKLRSKECTDLILEILGSNPAIIIVDGVDEVEESRRYELLKSLIRIKNESASVVKIFLSSRDNSNTFAHLVDAFKLRIQEDETRNDMQLFIKYHVSNAISNQTLLDGNVDDKLRVDLESFLLDRAGEMFLWVNLQMEKFCRFQSRTSIIEAMQDHSKASTKAINNMYTEILFRLSEKDPTAYQAAVRAFSWLLCMHEPLSPEAFLEAVSITEMEVTYETTLNEILAICSNLILLDDKQNTIRFAHLSVRQYLESRPDFDIVRINRVAAIGCLSACIRDMPYYIKGEICPEKDFDIYASMYWAKHYNIAVTNIPGQANLRSKLKDFIFEDDETNFSFVGWLETAQEISDSLPNDHPMKKELGSVANLNMTPLFAACVYGLLDVAQALTVRKDFDVDERNTLGHTGLYLACIFGHLEVVKLLLQHHADISIKCGQHKNSIFAACFAGHVEIVRLLLDQQDESKTARFREQGLEVAIHAGHENVVKLLFEDGLEISSQDDYNKLFASAIELGFSEIAQYMSKSFKSFSKSDPLLSNKLLESAISKGQLKYLMRYCEKDSLPDSIIATASFHGQNTIICWCLDKGLDIEKEGRFGTPLRTASLMGHQSTVRLLLERGADVNANGHIGDALQAACMKGHLSVTTLLLQNHANVNNKGGYYGTALQAASYRGHREVVEALLGAKAMIYEGGLFKDAFYAAVEAGQEEIISVFIKQGYRFPPLPCRAMARMGRPSHYRNLLQEFDTNKKNSYASKKRVEEGKSGNLEIRPVSDFEDAFRSARGISEPGSTEPAIRRPSIYHSEENKSYALETAASLGWEKLVKNMVENRESLDISVDDIGRALLETSISGHFHIVEYLLSTPLDLRSYIKGSIQRISWHGHISVLQLLLKYQEDWGLATKSSPSNLVTYWEKGRRPTRGDHIIENLISSDYVLQILLSSCRGDQPSILIVALRLVVENERQRLSDIALNEAAMSNSINVIKFLYQQGIIFDPDISREAFRGAAKYGSTSALACLIHHEHQKSFRSTDFQDSLAQASVNGHVDTVRILVAENFEKYDPLLLENLFVDVAKKGYLGVLKLLLPQICKCDSYPTTLSQSLDQACFCGHVDIAEFLIQRGADLNALVNKVSTSNDKDKVINLSLFQERRDAGYHYQFPRTPLQASLQGIPDLCTDDWHVRQFRKSKETTARKQEAVVHLLLRHGSDVRLVGGSGRSPLHSAALNCSQETVQALLKHGANINSDISEERTPLQCATRREVESLPIFRTLLEAGAQIIVDTVENGTKNSMLDVALAYFDQESGSFVQSESIEEVMTNGPGGVIKLLLEMRPELQATDERFCLLLQMAATLGDQYYIKLLIERNVNVNMHGHYFGCALQAAAKFGHLECVTLLLKAGADVNIIQGTFGTPLQAAIKSSHHEIVRIILHAGADVNLYIKAPGTTYDEKKYARMSPIELAIQSKSPQIVQLLLDAGAQTNAEMPLLHLATESGDLELLKILLDTGTSINKSFPGHAPVLISACGYENFDMVKLLLARSANVNADRAVPAQYNRTLDEDISALHKACALGNKPIVEILLDHKADLEKNVDSSLTPIGVATTAGHIDIMERLIAAGAKIYDSSRNLNVLKNAFQGSNQKAKMKFLLEKLSSSKDFIPACNQALTAAQDECDELLFTMLLKQLPRSSDQLSQASMLGYLHSVKLILAAGMDVNIDLTDNTRALHKAAYHQRVEMVSYLIAKGADVHCVSPRYGSPLFAALEGLLSASPSLPSPISALLPETIVQKNQSWFYHYSTSKKALDGKAKSCEEIVKLLLEAGVEVNCEPRLTGVPIHIAAYLGILSLVKLFLEKGADINSSGGCFGSSLIAGMIGGHEQVVQFLLDQGIDVNIPSHEFGTALHYASMKRNTRMMQVLLQHGADINANGSKQESPLSAILASSAGYTVGSSQLEETVNLLLQHRDKLRIRAKDIMLAASIRDYDLGEDNMKHLLEIGKDVQITAEMIAAAASTDEFLGGQKLELLLQRAFGVEITPEIFKSVQGPKNLRLLLQHKPRCEISSNIFETLVATNESHGTNMVKVIIEEEPNTPPTEAIIISLLKSNFNQSENFSLAKILLEKYPEFQISGSVLAAAHDARALKYLLSRYPNIPIDQKILEAIVSDQRHGTSRLQVLLDHDKTLEIGPSIIKACSKYSILTYLKILLQRNPDLEIPEDVFLNILWREGSPIRDAMRREFAELLLSVGKKMIFTPEIRKAIDEQFQSQSYQDLKKLYLELEKTDQDA